LNRVNRSQVPLQKVIEKHPPGRPAAARRHPEFVPSVLGEEPPPEEIDEFVLAFVRTPTTRRAHRAGTNLFGDPALRASRLRASALKVLSHISQRIKAETGLRAESLIPLRVLAAVYDRR